MYLSNYTACRFGTLALLGTILCTTTLLADPGNSSHAPRLNIRDHVFEQRLGTWDCVISTPGETPGEIVHTEAVETVKLVSNGRWLATEFSGEFMGEHYEAISILTYNEEKQVFTSYYFDGFNSEPTVSEGEWNESEQTLSMINQSFNAKGEPAVYRTVFSFPASGTYRMSVMPALDNGTLGAPLTSCTGTRR